MIERICFLVNYNLYESKRDFTEKLSEALRKKGIETEIIDLCEDPFNIDQAAKIKNFAPDLTCSFNSIPPLPSGKFLSDLLRIPHLSLLVDPALYSLQLINSPYSIISCVDRYDCDTFLEKGFQNVFFLPHATDGALKANTGERPYDIVFIGSCYDFESIRNSWENRFSLKIKKLLLEASERVLSTATLPMKKALEEGLQAANIEVEPATFAQLFYELDVYTRGIDRIELLRSLTDKAVYVYGDLMTDDERFCHGWSDYLTDRPNITVHAGVSFKTSLQILQLSKISLNSMPFFKAGSHERVFNSFSCGALPVSSYSLYLEEEFTPNDEILFYCFGKWDTLNKQIDDYLIHEKKRAQAVSQAQKKVMQKHTWDARADDLIQQMTSREQ